MQLVFKNSTLEADYRLSRKTEGLTTQQASLFWKEHKLSEEKMAFSILLGYLSSLCEIVEEYEDTFDSHPTLDLTYDTVKHLPLFLAQQYYAYVASGSFTSDKAIEILNKTLAAYLMLLCVNEHACIPDINRRKDFDWIFADGDTDETHAYSWAGFTIKVGVNRKHDMLQELSRTVKVTANGVLRIRISRAVEIYKRMCGVDLREKGLDDLEAHT